MCVRLLSPFEVFRHGGLPDVLEVVECIPGLCLPRPDVFLSGADIGSEVLNVLFDNE